MNNTKKWAFPAAVALVAGNLIGAGILAMPISLGLSGMLPSILIMIVYGGLMLFSGEVLLREAAAQAGEGYNLQTLFESHLGFIGKWVAAAANLLVLYGLMIAYITGGSKVLGCLLGVEGSPFWITAMLAAVPVTLASLKLSIIQKYNMALMLIMFCAFALMVAIGETKAEPIRMTHIDWSCMPAAIPLVLTAFYFHNIIPVTGTVLDWQEKRMRLAVVFGVLISFAMCLIWLQTGVCALPMEGPNSIHSAYLASQPATIPMSRIIGSRLFVVSATVFSLMTVVTAFTGSGVALQRFLRGLVPRAGTGAIRALALLPPVLIAMIWPNLFLKALDIVGGIGVVLLFGVLPSLIAIRKKGNSRGFRAAGWLFLFLSLIALSIETAQEFGLTHMNPNADVEYWKDESHQMFHPEKTE